MREHIRARLAYSDNATPPATAVVVRPMTTRRIALGIRRGRVDAGRKIEKAPTGIEPVCTALQAAA